MGRRVLSAITADDALLDEAKAYVEQAIYNHLSEPEVERIDIDVWADGPWGLRVSDVIVVGGGPKLTGWQQADLPNGIAVCAQAERVIITRAWMDSDAEYLRELELLLLLIDATTPS